jgi:SAM-dependent methyltransferase
MPASRPPISDRTIDEARFWGERQTPDVPDHRLRVRTSSPQELWEDPEVEAIARGAYVDRILRSCSPSGLEVLELACGCGWLALELARSGHNVRGIDLSPARIERARDYARALSDGGRILGRLEYEIGDLRTLPLPDARYDRIVCWDGLHHIAPIGPVIERIHAALRPGGQLLLFDHIGPASGLQKRIDQALAGFAVALCQPTNLPKLLRTHRQADHRAPSEDATGPEMIHEAIRVFGPTTVHVETALGLGKRWLSRLRGPHRIRLAVIRTICSADRLWIRTGLLRGEYVFIAALRPLAAGTSTGRAGSILAGDGRLPPG